MLHRPGRTCSTGGRGFVGRSVVVTLRGCQTALRCCRSTAGPMGSRRMRGLTDKVVVVAGGGSGIGAATAVFSVVDGVLLSPLPYPHSDRIMRLFEAVGLMNLFEANGCGSASSELKVS